MPLTRSLRLKVVDRPCPKGHLCLYYPYLLPVGKLININDPYVGRSQWSVRRSSSFEVPITYQRLFNVFDQILIFSTFFDISDRKPAFLTFWTKKQVFRKFWPNIEFFDKNLNFWPIINFLTFSFTKKRIFWSKNQICSNIDFFSRKRFPGGGFYSVGAIFDLIFALGLTVHEISAILGNFKPFLERFWPFSSNVLVILGHLFHYFCYFWNFGVTKWIKFFITI